MKQWFFVVICSLLLVACQRADAPPETLRGQIFGTFYEVSIAASEHYDAEQLSEGITAELNKVDQQMSTYRQDSVLMAVNNGVVGEPVVVPEELFYVLQVAQQVSEYSGGAFDTTVGGLVNLWGFGPEGRITKAPPAELIEERLAQVGYRYIVLDEANRTVTRHADIFIDLSGIAKGFAVDQVSGYLQSQGIENFLVNIGGDLRAAGMRNPGPVDKARHWRIGIEVPTDRQQIAQQILPVHNVAMLGSGDYRNYFEENGVRYSHTISPRTGKPITHKLAAVHVIMDNATEADAWATALLVLGEEFGYQLANERDIAAVFVYRNNGAFSSLLSQAFEREYAAQLVVPTYP
ncbi:FAD:protein FMN transferase [Aliidiomarina celeris]|uniref:FAD:protein FMN transferase n=1 Tax=Aliidiomarina celeris TaxID=2249428 RepID=UPI000DE9AD83|nr:FAD:protein FMN transferase [Aliidiomarina celeris]